MQMRLAPGEMNGLKTEGKYYRFPMANSDQRQQNNKAQSHDEFVTMLT